jgi:hypothetical protein
MFDIPKLDLNKMQEETLNPFLVPIRKRFKRGTVHFQAAQIIDAYKAIAKSTKGLCKYLPGSEQEEQMRSLLKLLLGTRKANRQGPAIITADGKDYLVLPKTVLYTWESDLKKDAIALYWRERERTGARLGLPSFDSGNASGRVTYELEGLISTTLLEADAMIHVHPAGGRAPPHLEVYLHNRQIFD